MTDVVATLKNASTIAVIVRSHDRGSAKIAADAIGKLGATGQADVTSEGNTGAADAPEAADTEEEQPKEPYPAAVFIQTVFAGPRRNLPLQGAVKKGAAGILENNRSALNELGFGDTHAWIVHPAHVKPNDSDGEYWKTKTSADMYRSLVVVRSASFYTDDGEQKLPILVCNAPVRTLAKNAKSLDASVGQFYTAIFARIVAFVAWYNDQNQQAPLMYVALPYLGGVDIQDNPPTSKAKPAARKAKKTAPKKKTKTQAETLDSEDAESESADAGGDELDSESNSGSEFGGEGLYTLFANMWIERHTVLKAGLRALNVRLVLMSDKGAWLAPAKIAALFEDNRTVPAFPACMVQYHIGIVNGIDNRTRTMFVCDLLAGNRVGNGNDSATTGGVFGMYVPMHLTAEYTKSTGNYTNNLIQFLEVPV